MNTRHKRSAMMRIDHPAKAIFPLLCPVREYEWIAYWDCTLHYSESGYAEKHCVFSTQLPPDSPRDVWVISNYEPERYIEFIRSDGHRSMVYSITLSEEGNTTLLEWTMLVTVLDDQGEAYVEHWTQDRFALMIAGLEKRLVHYLDTGTCLQEAPVT